MIIYTAPEFLDLCVEHVVNHQFFVIARREASRRRRADRRGNPGKNLPQALTIYNACLFLTWITTLHDSASSMNHSARDDGKPSVYSVYRLQHKNYGVM
jgi:hypothetical protein